MPTPQRRLTDVPGAHNTDAEIRAMILGTSSAETRAILLVLQQLAEQSGRMTETLVTMNSNLETHETAFADHVENFNGHAEREEKRDTEYRILLARGIAGWKTVAVVGPALLSLVGAFAVYSLNLHIDSIHAEIRVNEAQQKMIDLNSNRLTAIETEVRSLRNALLRP